MKDLLHSGGGRMTVALADIQMTIGFENGCRRRIASEKEWEQKPAV